MQRHIRRLLFLLFATLLVGCSACGGLRRRPLVAGGISHGSLQIVHHASRRGIWRTWRGGGCSSGAVVGSRLSP